MNQINFPTIFVELQESGKCDRAILLETIRELEKQKIEVKNSSKLKGEWQLIWTSGTKKYQQLQRLQTASQIYKTKQTILQKINSQSKQIENKVVSAIASFNVIGSFEYINNKIEFIFTQIEIEAKFLPAIAIPMGSWAKGWLKTTYLDENWHIERGDRGGISLYAKIENEQL